MDQTTWMRDETWVGSAIEDSFVMVNVESGQYVALNPTANAVWSALAQPSTTDEVETQVRAEYEVSAEDCRRSVGILLGRMQELGLATTV